MLWAGAANEVETMKPQSKGKGTEAAAFASQWSGGDEAPCLHDAEAFAKSLDNEWYEFDDSRVSQVNPTMLKSSICTNAAYNLFYRRRDFYEANKANLDFEKIAIRPEVTTDKQK